MIHKILSIGLPLVGGLLMIALLFSSCVVDCRGAGRQNGYVGYDAGGHKASKLVHRKSY